MNPLSSSSFTIDFRQPVHPELLQNALQHAGITPASVQPLEPPENGARFYTETIPAIRAKLQQLEPEHLPRVDQLVQLLANLDEYVVCVKMSIIGYDPDDPSPESILGDTVLDETIAALRTLPTVRAEFALPPHIAAKLKEISPTKDPTIPEVST